MSMQRIVTVTKTAVTENGATCVRERNVRGHPADARRPARAACVDGLPRFARHVGRKRPSRSPTARCRLLTRASNLCGVRVPRLSDIVLAMIYEGIEESAAEHDLSTFVA